MKTAQARSWIRAQQERVEQALDNWLPTHAPAGLNESMRYAVLDGGKRLRPLLTLAAGQAVQALPQAALRAACAVELIHAYSLVHDDLPCMDNDVLRRDKPTVHVRFGEAGALLAGDALQALAFELLTPQDQDIPPAMQARLCQLLSRAAGSMGMAGGQAIDLASVGKTLTEAELRQMHELKTGALLRASICMGASCTLETLRASDLQALEQFGTIIGLAFQVVDDILDATADTHTLGKTAGKDSHTDKPTYVSIMGLDNAQAMADELLQQAHHSLDQCGLQNLAALRLLASMLVHRNR